jgi:hypothetical protein
MKNFKKHFFIIIVTTLLGSLLFTLFGDSLIENINESQLREEVSAEETIGIYSIEDLNDIRNNVSGSYALMKDLDFNNPNDWEDYNENYDTVLESLSYIEDERLGTCGSLEYTVDFPPINPTGEIEVQINSNVIAPYEPGVTGGWQVVDYDTGTIVFLEIDGTPIRPSDLYGISTYYSIMVSYPLVNEIFQGWSPIASDGDLREGSTTFTGSLDGNNHTVSNLFINRVLDYTPLGLFAFIGQGSEISNLNLEEVDITGPETGDTLPIGGLSAYNQGMINNSFVSGNIHGRSNIGGLVGRNLDGVISNSRSQISIYSNGWYVGGLVGSNSEGTITNSHSSGEVVGTQKVGGLVGNNSDGEISLTHSNCNVTASGNEIGGLVGINKLGTIINSYAIGNVSGYDYVGGLVGVETSNQFWGSMTIYNSYSSGNVIGNQYVGGFSGYSDGTIYDSYSTGEVTGNTEYTGAFSGYNRGSITSSYTIGSVYYDEPPHPTDKGFIGNEYVGTNYEDKNNLFDSEASNQLTTTGNATARNTSQMKSFSTYTELVSGQIDESWDIANIFDFLPTTPKTWYIDNGNDYPKLFWEYIQPSISTKNTTNISDTSVNLVGTVNTVGSIGTVEVYFQYSQIGGTWISTPKATKTSTGDYSYTLTNLNPNTNYEYRAVIEYGTSNIQYGDVKTYKTNKTVIPKVVITDIGLIDDVPDRDSLLYYFTSTIPTIKGEAYPNSRVKFQTDGEDFTTQVNRSGEFEIQFEVPRGSNEIQYYAYNDFASQSESRELTLVVGTEYFPDWLLEKLGLIDPPEEEIEEEPIEDSEEEVEEDIEEEEDSLEENPVDENTPPTSNTRTIKFTDDRGNPLTQAVVEIEGKRYVTDSNGMIAVEGLEDRSYSAEIRTQDGKTYYSEILGSEQGEIVVQIEADSFNIRWIYIFLFGGIIILLISISIVLYRR